MFKIQALLLSIILFFVGLIYGDKPVEIDYTVSINGTEISAGDNFDLSDRKSLVVSYLCENKGRPFEGIDIYSGMVGFYKFKDGEKKYLSVSYIGVDAEPRPILIKRGEKFNVSSYLNLNPDAEPGVYSMEVNIYGCEQIYENVLTVK